MAIKENIAMETTTNTAVTGFVVTMETASVEASLGRRHGALSRVTNEKGNDSGAETRGTWDAKDAGESQPLTPRNVFPNSSRRREALKAEGREKPAAVAK